MITAATITEADIDGLRRHALLYADFRLAAMCEEAAQILRDRARGLTEWPAESPPRPISYCAARLTSQFLEERALDNSGK